MRILLIFFFVFASFICAQTDWTRWEGKTVSYNVPVQSHHEYTIDKSSFGMKTLSLARNAYYFFISDLDGDNCPFYPSCSAFFVDAVKETNILKGMLMFSDRFTRDIYFFKGSAHYPYYTNGRFYDPVSNYTLHPEELKYYPGGVFIKSGDE